MGDETEAPSYTQVGTYCGNDHYYGYTDDYDAIVGHKSETWDPVIVDPATASDIYARALVAEAGETFSMGGRDFKVKNKPSRGGLTLYVTDGSKFSGDLFAGNGAFRDAALAAAEAHAKDFLDTVDDEGDDPRDDEWHDPLLVGADAVDDPLDGEMDADTGDEMDVTLDVNITINAEDITANVADELRRVADELDAE